MDPSIKSALDDQILKANLVNARAIDDYRRDYQFWKQGLPLYAACIPPVKGPDEPQRPKLRSVDAEIFEDIYVAYNTQRTDVGSKGGDVDISSAFRYEEYEPPVEVVAGPPKQPKNPIGVLISDEEDDIHAPALGDALPAGSMYEMKATGVTYQKFRKKPNAMGIASFVWVPFEG